MAKCSWKKFYAERKMNYKTKFPFLKEDQVTAKLKRIWNKKEKNVCCQAKTSSNSSHKASPPLPLNVLTKASPPLPLNVPSFKSPSNSYLGPSPTTLPLPTTLSSPSQSSTSGNNQLHSVSKNGILQEGSYDVLCDMFSPVPDQPNTTPPQNSDDSATGFCLFLNEKDIFM